MLNRDDNLTSLTFLKKFSDVKLSRIYSLLNRVISVLMQASMWHFGVTSDEKKFNQLRANQHIYEGHIA